MAATQTPLFSHPPETFSQGVPDLAARPATISPDGMTITVHIRRGIHFGPPVNREVVATDVAYAIERGANPNVGNPYFHKYFSSLVGAGLARGGRLAGITTPGRYTIVFHLTDRSAEIVLAALSLPLSAPVPQNYAKRYDALRPSRYGDHQVATGPYMLKSNRAGKVVGVGYIPRRSATLVRNPAWVDGSDFRPAYLNEIKVAIARDSTADGRRVLKGSHLVQSDPADSVVRLAHHRFSRQLQISSGAGLAYIALNNKRGPFSSVDIRKALWAALDRAKMTQAAGAGLTARVATHFLYPGIPGFSLAEQLIAGQKPAYDIHPKGDLLVAGRYLKHAGYSSGKYVGTHVVSVVGEVGASSSADRVVVAALKRLGFRAKLTLVTKANMYSRYCGVPANEIDICVNAGRRTDVADGQALLDSIFNGKAIRASGNENWGQVDDPDLNSAIERESLVIGKRFREQSWAAVDNGLVGDAVAIPYAWLSQPAIESRDVLGVGELWNSGAWDFSFTALR
jgi:peptide/nickel transport system substrate-binding protein